MGPSANEVRQWLAANVAAARKRHGWTQATLAERAEVDLMTVQNIESARTTAKVTTLLALAEALGVRADVLLRPRNWTKAPRGRPKQARRRAPSSRGAP
jgi:transcriptional regulator with XRE-family HTH domain